MTAMMMCIIMVSIMLLRVPIPFTQGYVNLSDAMIFMAVIILGWKTCIRTSYGIFWMTVWLRLFTVPEQPLISDPFMAIILAQLDLRPLLGIKKPSP